MPRPYEWRRIRRHSVFIYDNNPMHMIWHNHKRAQFNIRKMFGDSAPTFIGDLTKFIQLHLLVNDFPKQQIALIGHNYDKISTWLV